MLGCICAQSGCTITRIWLKLCANFTKQFLTYSTMAVWTWLLFDFRLYAHSQPNVKWNERKVQTDVFPILIYEFNVYLFFKKRGGGHWRGELVGRNTVRWKYNNDVAHKIFLFQYKIQIDMSIYPPIYTIMGTFNYIRIPTNYLWQNLRPFPGLSPKFHT